MELGRSVQYNAHNTRSLIYTLKYVQNNIADKIPRWRGINTYTHRHTQTHTHTHTHTHTRTHKHTQLLINIIMILVNMLLKSVLTTINILLVMNLAKRAFNCCQCMYGNQNRAILDVLITRILLWNHINMFLDNYKRNLCICKTVLIATVRSSVLLNKCDKLVSKCPRRNKCTLNCFEDK